MYFFVLFQPLPFKPQVQSPMCYQPKHSRWGFCSDRFHPQTNTNHSSAGFQGVSWQCLGLYDWGLSQKVSIIHSVIDNHIRGAQVRITCPVLSTVLSWKSVCWVYVTGSLEYPVLCFELVLLWKRGFDQQLEPKVWSFPKRFLLFFLLKLNSYWQLWKPGQETMSTTPSGDIYHHQHHHLRFHFLLLQQTYMCDLCCHLHSVSLAQ